MCSGKISGGTGYAPFHQFLHERLLLTGPDNGPNCRITLLHGSRNIEELPPAQYLDPLLDFAQQHPDRLSVHLFVDESPAKWQSTKYAVTQGRINAQAIRHCLGMPDANKSSWWAKLWGATVPTFGRAGQPFKRDGKVLLAVCGPEPCVCYSSQRFWLTLIIYTVG